MPAHSETLQCSWDTWRALGDGQLALEIPEHNRCDMLGVIKTANVLLPGVWRIAVSAGGVPDIEYRKVDGQWKAYARQ